MDLIGGSPEDDKKEKKAHKKKDKKDTNSVATASTVDESQFPVTVKGEGGTKYVRGDLAGGLVGYTLECCPNNEEYRWKAKWDPGKSRLFFSKITDKSQRVWKLPAVDAATQATVAEPGSSPTTADKKEKKKEKKKDKEAKEEEATAMTPSSMEAYPPPASALPTEPSEQQPPVQVPVVIPSEVETPTVEQQSPNSLESSGNGGANKKLRGLDRLLDLGYTPEAISTFREKHFSDAAAGGGGANSPKKLLALSPEASTQPTQKKTEQVAKTTGQIKQEDANTVVPPMANEAKKESTIGSSGPKAPSSMATESAALQIQTAIRQAQSEKQVATKIMNSPTSSPKKKEKESQQQILAAKDDDDDDDDDERKARDCLAYFAKTFDLNNDGVFDQREATIFAAFNKGKATPDEALEGCEDTIQNIVGKSMEQYLKDAVLPKPFPPEALQQAQEFSKKWIYWQLPSPRTLGKTSEEQKRNKELRGELVKFFATYDPGRMGDVDNMLESFQGRENDMLEVFEGKYGARPSLTSRKQQTQSNTEKEGEKEPSVDPKVRSRLQKFYQKYAPEKLTNMDAMLHTFAGREDELFAALTQKYGEDPSKVPKAGSQPSPAQTAPAVVVNRDVYRQRLVKIYTKYSPAKLVNLDVILQACPVGQEEEMMASLTEKYGSEPTQAEVEAILKKREGDKKVEAAQRNAQIVHDVHQHSLQQMRGEPGIGKLPVDVAQALGNVELDQRNQLQRNEASSRITLPAAPFGQKSATPTPSNNKSTPNTTTPSSATTSGNLGSSIPLTSEAKAQLLRLQQEAVDTLMFHNADYCLALLKLYQDFAQTSPGGGRGRIFVPSPALNQPPMTFDSPQAQRHQQEEQDAWKKYQDTAQAIHNLKKDSSLQEEVPPAQPVPHQVHVDATSSPPRLPEQEGANNLPFASPKAKFVFNQRNIPLTPTVPKDLPDSTKPFNPYENSPGQDVRPTTTRDLSLEATSSSPKPRGSSGNSTTFLQWDYKRSSPFMELAHNSTMATANVEAVTLTEGQLAKDPRGSSPSSAPYIRQYYTIGTIGIAKGEFVFEVRIDRSSSCCWEDAPSSFDQSPILVGVASKYFRGSKGRRCPAYLYRCDGSIVANSNDESGIAYGVPLFMKKMGEGHVSSNVTVVTVHLDLTKWELSFYVNGDYQGVAFRFSPMSDPEPLFPVVVLTSPGDSVVLQTPSAVTLPSHVSPARRRGL